MIGLYAQAVVVVGWLLYGGYLAYVNYRYASEAEKYGVGAWGMYWPRINVEDSRCPNFLRRKVISNSRRFRVLNGVTLLLVVFIEIVSRNI